MSATQTLDFDALLAPIEADPPAGADVRRDHSPTSRYRQIKDARNKARRQENQSVWDDDQTGTPAEWGVVLREAPALISEQSKDLEVAAWLTEALAREHGFAGLRDGFRLCRELINRYWDDLHPNLAPDDPEDPDEVPIRAAALGGLNGDEHDGPLVATINAVSLVSSDEFGPLGLSSFRQAAALEKLEDPNERATRLEHGGVSMQMFEKAVAASPAAFFRALLGDIEAAQHEFSELCQTLEGRCGPDRAPPSSNIRQALSDCRSCVTAISRDILAADTPAEGLAAADVGTGGSIRTVDGPIQSRDQAFAVISQVAQFFRRTEPQSVLAWQLEECIRWGRMSLPELLEDLIADGSAREQLFRRVGIPPPAND